MKKIIAFILCTTMAVSVAGCKSAPASSKASSAPNSSAAVSSAPASSAPASSSVSSAKSIEEDKSSLSVSVTLPAFLFIDTNVDEAVENAKKANIGEVTKNSDGSITYKMSKDTQNKMLNEINSSLISSIDEAKSRKDFKSIQDITYSDDFSQITFVVDKPQYENSIDSFAALDLYITSAYYQLFNGTKPDKVKVTFKIQDAATKEIFNTIVYPNNLSKTVY